MGERFRNIPRRDLPVIEITLRTPLDSIPQPDSCSNCGGQQAKELIHQAATGNTAIVKAKVPGYRCVGECGTASYSNEGELEFFMQTRRVLRPRQDSNVLFFTQVAKRTIGFLRGEKIQRNTTR